MKGAMRRKNRSPASSTAGRAAPKQKAHVTLNEEELATFRTGLCEGHQLGSCTDSDSCPNSHCLTWQRRCPFDTPYSPKLCPEIQFVKKGSKMTLVRRCNRGRNCLFAHSKEEELYHPLMYKTKMCSAHPTCNRCYCPFAHSAPELRRPFANPRVRSHWGKSMDCVGDALEDSSNASNSANSEVPSRHSSIAQPSHRQSSTGGNKQRAASSIDSGTPQSSTGYSGVPRPPSNGAANSSNATAPMKFSIPPPPPPSIADLGPNGSIIGENCFVGTTRLPVAEWNTQITSAVTGAAANVRSCAPWQSPPSSSAGPSVTRRTPIIQNCNAVRQPSSALPAGPQQSGNFCQSDRRGENECLLPLNNTASPLSDDDISLEALKERLRAARPHLSAERLDVFVQLFAALSKSPTSVDSQATINYDDCLFPVGASAPALVLHPRRLDEVASADNSAAPSFCSPSSTPAASEPESLLAALTNNLYATTSPSIPEYSIGFQSDNEKAVSSEFRYLHPNNRNGAVYPSPATTRAPTPVTVQSDEEASPLTVKLAEVVVRNLGMSLQGSDMSVSIPDGNRRSDSASSSEHLGLDVHQQSPRLQRTSFCEVSSICSIAPSGAPTRLSALSPSPSTAASRVSSPAAQRRASPCSLPRSSMMVPMMHRDSFSQAAKQPRASYSSSATFVSTAASLGLQCQHTAGTDCRCAETRTSSLLSEDLFDPTSTSSFGVRAHSTSSSLQCERSPSWFDSSETRGKGAALQSALSGSTVHSRTADSEPIANQLTDAALLAAALWNATTQAGPPHQSKGCDTEDYECLWNEIYGLGREFDESPNRRRGF